MRNKANSPNPGNPFGLANPTWGIFLMSVLALFLEMMLIRWVGAEVRIFAYLQNTVLIVCFLGLGLGCFTARQPFVLGQTLIPLSLLVLFLAIPSIRKIFGATSDLLSVLGDLVIWYKSVSTDPWTTFASVGAGCGLTYIFMLFLFNIFVPIGRLLGRLLASHPNPFWAYSVNVAGSLLGTWLFVLLSVFYLPPVVWLVVSGVLFLFFANVNNRDGKISLILLIGLIALGWLSGKVPSSIEVVWSPYQKLALQKSDPQQIGEYVINVNNVGYQTLIDLSEKKIASRSQKYPANMLGLSQYDIPFLLHPHPQTCLIVGAGAGNDVAGGLRHHVKHIVAVEIDPAIISLGTRYHPERPYSSPAVHIVNDDARSFFASNNEKYDVISFGLLDSHTTTAMTNARLDHYVYTRESIRRAKSLLTKNGIIVLSFEAQKPYIADRIAKVLRDEFGEDPLTFRIPRTHFGWGGVMFISGDLATARRQIAHNQRLATFIAKLKQENPLDLTYQTKVASDDWPYIYLQKPAIPTIYYLFAGLTIFLLVPSYMTWKTAGLFARWSRSYWHFFFLGAAFLLLEVQNISKASVILGNTWQVNAVIVSGVLSMVLLANLTASKFPNLPLSLVYAILIPTCLASYLIDLSSFGHLPYAAKAIIVGGLTTSPMFFSGIVFINSFAITDHKDKALGANLVGALTGALLQSVTFITGIKALLLFVTGFYLLSLITKPTLRYQERS